jgi:integrase
MPYVSPPTLTREEQRSLLGASAGHPRDHLAFSVTLGTGLRLGEIVGLNVGDVLPGRPGEGPYTAASRDREGRPRGRRLPAGGFGPQLQAFRAYKLGRRECLDQLTPLYL